MNIKNLKPTVNGRTHQGLIDPRSCKKLFPGLSSDKIIFRSSWERRFVYYCETNKNIKYWGSECITIPYTYLVDGTQHTYNPDFVVETVTGERWVVEIKPKSQCVRPVNENCWMWKEYTKNMSKWVAAKKFCEDRNIKFKILTEETINNLY